MKNGYNWHNVFILFDFGHEVWKMFIVVKNPNCYRLHEVLKRWRACVSKVTCRRLVTIMILDPQTIYVHAMWMKISLVAGDTYLQNCLVYKCCKSISDFFLTTHSLDICILSISLFKHIEVNTFALFSMGLCNLALDM